MRSVQRYEVMGVDVLDLLDPAGVLLAASVAPSQSVAIHTRTISSAIAEPMILPPRHSTLVSECERASPAQNGSWHTAAYMPAILFAIIALP